MLSATGFLLLGSADRLVNLSKFSAIQQSLCVECTWNASR